MKRCVVLLILLASAIMLKAQFAERPHLGFCDDTYSRTE